MCNHYRANPEALKSWAEHYGWAWDDAFSEVGLDIWPKRPGVVARLTDGERRMEAMRWGFELELPGKRPGTTRKSQVTNIRNLDSPMWRSRIAAPAKRCIVPFTQFAEPKPGKDPDTGRPAEYWFNVVERDAAAFAGIWDMWGGEPVFAFLTCEPNSLVAPRHPKAMPVILDEADYDRWLTGSDVDARGLAVPYPAQLMTIDS